VADPLRVALLLSTNYFEEFYGASLGMSREQYLSAYRNDWSWDYCEMLGRAGVPCAIYVPTIEDGDRVTTADGYTVRFLPLSKLFAPWLRYPVLSRTPVGRYISQAVNAGSFLRALRQGLAEDDVDILCVQEYWTARFDVLAHAIDVPIVAIDQGVPDRRELKLLKRSAFRHCGGVVVQTSLEAAKVGRFGGDAVRIPNAVDTAMFSPDGDTESAPTPTILCVGRLHDVQKRLTDVIRALARLPADWRLEIAGTGPDRPMLEQLAAQLGVAERVAFLGFVSDPAELRRLYRRASVMALPSAYEGLPMVLLEAMSCGTPVVGSDIAAISEVIRDGASGLLVPVGDPERLASAMERAVSERDRFGAAARASVLETYDQTVVAPRLADMLRRANRQSVPAR
jgi:glycosyltransferase involved in cell wall biosynthesis